MPSQISLAHVKAAIDRSSAVIFDNDGTLCDSMPVHYLVWRDALAQFGISFTETDFYSMAGLPAEAILNVLTEKQQVTGVTIEQLQAERMRRVQHLLPSIQPVKPMHEALLYALEKGLPVAVASGGEKDTVLSSLKYAGIDPTCFSAVVTSEDVTHGKPHPETFLLAAKLLGVDPTLCVGFEDGDKGMEALHAAKMEAIDVRLVDGYPLPEYYLRK